MEIHREILSPIGCIAFAQDGEDNKIFQRTKLAMPVLAVGGKKSFGATEGQWWRAAMHMNPSGSASWPRWSGKTVAAETPPS